MAAVTISIGTAARDYATFALAKADDWGGDGLGNDAITANVYNDSVYEDDPCAPAESYLSLHVTVPESERHDGTDGVGSRIVATTTVPFGGLVNLFGAIASTTVDWLEVDGGGNSMAVSLGLVTFSASALGTYRVRWPIVHGVHDQANNVAEGVTLDGGDQNNVLELTNFIVYGIQRSGAGSRNAYGVRTDDIREGRTALNGSIHGITADDGTLFANGVFWPDNAAGHRLQNIIVTEVGGTASGSHADFNSSITTGTEDHNHSSDESASGTGSTTGIDPADIYVSIEPGMEDFHLKSGASVIGLGADLGTAPDGIEIDIDGQDRTGLTWDPGADQFVAGGTVVSGDEVLGHGMRLTAEADGASAFFLRGSGIELHASGSGVTVTADPFSASFSGTGVIGVIRGNGLELDIVRDDDGEVVFRGTGLLLTLDGQSISGNGVTFTILDS